MLNAAQVRVMLLAHVVGELSFQRIRFLLWRRGRWTVNRELAELVKMGLLERHDNVYQVGAWK